jgi:hypothetical protein
MWSGRWQVGYDRFGWWNRSGLLAIKSGKKMARGFQQPYGWSMMLGEEVTELLFSRSGGRRRSDEVGFSEIV